MDKREQDTIEGIKETRSGIRKYFHDVFNIRDDMMSYEEIDEMMEENTVIHGANMWILMMAALIASIGLNVNSTAVIIGAMLISPLMSGIITMGYSLAVRDLPLLKKSLIRFGTQVAISLAASTLYFLISPLETPTSEMIARTSPTLWDVLIALFGGIAGMIGNTRQKKGNVIPGVAIATALMPPLCTAGYGIATLQPQFLFGAFYLFLINTLFIMLSSAFIALILGAPRHKFISPKQQKRINRAIILITVITIIPSVYIGMVTVRDSVMERNVSSYLSEEFSFPDAQVVQSNVNKQEKEIAVSLVGTPISEDAVAALEKELPKYNLEGYSLRVTQNSMIEDTTGEDADKITIAVQENRISELQKELEESQGQVETLEKELKGLETAQNQVTDCQMLAQKAQTIFTEIKACSCGIMSDTAGDYVMVVAEVPEPLSEEEQSTITRWIQTETGLERVEILQKEAKEDIDTDTAMTQN